MTLEGCQYVDEEDEKFIFTHGEVATVWCEKRELPPFEENPDNPGEPGGDLEEGEDGQSNGRAKDELTSATRQKASSSSRDVAERQDSQPTEVLPTRLGRTVNG